MLDTANAVPKEGWPWVQGYAEVGAAAAVGEHQMAADFPAAGVCGGEDKLAVVAGPPNIAE